VNVSVIDPSLSVSRAPAAEPPGAWRMLAYLALAEFLGMTLWFSATAVTPLLVRELDLTPTHASWLTIAVQAGFVVGTLASAVGNLSDVLNARTVMLLGCVAGAAANAALLIAPGAAVVVGLRFATGMALALVYPPGMKVAAGWFKERRGLALGVLIGALTLGKAFPHLLTAIYGERWREPVLMASGLALLGGVLVFAVVRDGPFAAATSRFDPHAIRRIVGSRGARLATFGYLGHMWELYAMWTWIAVLATASFERSGVPSAAAAGSLAAFLAIASGTLGCGLAGWLADRLGRARVAIWSMWISAACAVLTAAAFGQAPFWFYLLAMIWGFAVVADSAQFSAIVSEHSPAQYLGTALTLQTCCGFLLTMVTIELLPRVAAATGWQWAALLLVPGPLLGIAAMRRL